MTRLELLDTIGNGENSGIEFKRDDLPTHDLAKELVAFLNLEGGAVLLGVEDDRHLRHDPAGLGGVGHERVPRPRSAPRDSVL